MFNIYYPALGHRLQLLAASSSYSFSARQLGTVVFHHIPPASLHVKESEWLSTPKNSDNSVEGWQDGWVRFPSWIRPADEVDCRPCLFFCSSHVSSREYLRDLVSVVCSLQTAGVWIRFWITSLLCAFRGLCCYKYRLQRSLWNLIIVFTVSSIKLLFFKII